MLERIKDLLARNDSIGVAVGKNPGIDEMAAALSLYLAFSQIPKKVSSQQAELLKKFKDA